MLEQVSGCEVSDGSKTGDASDSDDHVEGREVVRGLDVGDGGRGVGVARGVQFDDDELAVGADWEGGEGEAGFVLWVTDSCDYGVVGLGQIVGDETTANAYTVEVSVVAQVSVSKWTYRGCCRRLGSVWLPF